MTTSSAIPQDTVSAIVADYLSGMKTLDVASKHRVHICTVLESVRRRGHHVRNASESRRSHVCDHHYFDAIDTEAKAYWLGFFSADGCVNSGNRIALVLASADCGHVEKFRDALGSDHPIAEVKSRGFGGGYTAVRFTVRSPEMTAALARLGVGARKSMTFVAPALRPDLVRHFWRGMVDGDGCIFSVKTNGAWGVGLTGSRASMEQYAAFVATLCPTRATLQPNGRIWSFPVTTHNAAAVLHELYGGATVYLDRKHSLYLRASAENFGAKRPVDAARQRLRRAA